MVFLPSLLILRIIFVVFLMLKPALQPSNKPHLVNILHIVEQDMLKCLRLCSGVLVVLLFAQSSGSGIRAMLTSQNA